MGFMGSQLDVILSAMGQSSPGVQAGMNQWGMQGPQSQNLANHALAAMMQGLQNAYSMPHAVMAPATPEIPAADLVTFALAWALASDQPFERYRLEAWGKERGLRLPTNLDVFRSAVPKNAFNPLVGMGQSIWAFGTTVASALVELARVVFLRATY